MTPQELKDALLQRAIQGRLVPQDPKEGTGEELLRQIRLEKEKLVKVGKIKKEKPLPEIKDDEKPFEIPDNWTWTRLGFVTTYAQPKNKIVASNIKPEAWALDLEDIAQGGELISRTRASERKINGDKTLFSKGSILFSKLRPYLLKILIADSDGVCTPELMPFDVYGKIDKKWVVFFLRSPFANYTINAATYGMKMPRVGTETMVNLLFPLPPLAEQKRIVAKRESIKPFVERFDRAKTSLDEISRSFPDDLRRGLLQRAIEGRLVARDASEGTGADLLREIQKEKQALIAAGKIKKEKPLPEIKDDEKPFEIPEHWTWVRLGKCTTLENGDRSGRYPTAADYAEYGIPFFGAKDMVNGQMSFDSVRYISEQKFSELGNGKLCEGDFICLLRGSVGKCAVFTSNERHNTGFICAQMVIVRPFYKAINKYLNCFFESYYYSNYMVVNSTGTAVRQLPAYVLETIPVPLPPLGEQKRIAAKLESLLPLCDRLTDAQQADRL